VGGEIVGRDVGVDVVGVVVGTQVGMNVVGWAVGSDDAGTDFGVEVDTDQVDLAVGADVVGVDAGTEDMEMQAVGCGVGCGTLVLRGMSTVMTPPGVSRHMERGVTWNGVIHRKTHTQRG
jgi:hypothetical protein